MFYEFRQNNSGGSFDFDCKIGIGVHVWVEADNVDEANKRAEAIGIYFDGCEMGVDCDCCGDRWARQESWGYGGKDDGQAEPVIDNEYHFAWHPVIFIHRKDGTIERRKADGTVL